VNADATFVFLTLDGGAWNFRGFHSRTSALSTLSKAKHELAHDQIVVLELPSGKPAYTWTRDDRLEDTQPKG
jgi:hypothetical protein